MIPTSVRRALPALAGLAAAAALLAGCAGGAPAPVTRTTAADPVATSASTATDAPPTTGPRIAMIGDSLMSGYGLEKPDAWPELLARADGIEIADLACAGMGFVAVGQCDTTYDGMVPAVMALEPDVVIVQSSDNDSLVDPDELRTATLATMEHLREAVPDAQLVCLSTLWNDEDEVPDEVSMTGQALAEAADATGCLFVDVGQPLAGHPEWFQEDEAHPNVEGQQALAIAIGEALVEAGVLPSSLG
jgi:acyl-CoA thioesterase I